MRRIALSGLLLFSCSALWGSSGPESAFIQTARTTKGSDPAPTQPTPVAGVPAAEARPTATNPLPVAQSPQLAPAVVGQPQSPQPEPPEQPQAEPPRPQRKPTTASPLAARRGQSIDFSFTNASIDSVVSAIMKELGYSYVIDPQVSGEVNVYTQGEIARDQLFPILEQLLKMNGNGIVKQGELYIILPLGQTPKIPGQILLHQEPVTPTPEPEPAAQEQSPPPQQGAGTPPATPGPQPIILGNTSEQQLAQAQGVITYIIPLQYLPSSEMVEMAKAFVSDGATVIDFQSANIVILTDYKANIEQVLRLVDLLDTQYFSINTVDLIPVRYNKAADVAEDLGKVFAPGDKAGGVRIVAIERLNSILVVTHATAVFNEVKKWIDKLDAPSAGSNVKTFVYQVENNTAGNIAEILAQLYEDGAGLPSGAPSEEQQGSQPPASRREAGFLPEQGSQQFGSFGPSLGSRSNQPGVRAVVTGNIKIIVNEFNNSLIIQGTEADYQFLRQTIEQLDVLPRQVFIEAEIYTVELRDDLQYGVAAFLRERGTVGFGDGSGVSDTLPPPTLGSFDSTGALSASTRVFAGARQIDLLVNALRSKTNVQMLEAPTLLVIDGTEAQINVGAEVPVTTASFGDPLRSGSGTAFVNSIRFRPTGTTLLLLPRISASGIVTLELAIEVSSATGSALTPTINRNYVQTSLIARDNQTVAIAGVISDSLNNTRERVPLLGDIPILGALFGQTRKDKRRFELVFLITPRVVRNLSTAVELTLDFRRALRNAYGYIDKKQKERWDLVNQRRQEELQQQTPPETPPR